MLHILAMAAAHPEQTIDNDFIVGLGVDTTKEWIVDKIGVESRKTSLPLSYVKETRNQKPQDSMSVATDSPFTLGVKAARKVLHDAGISAAQIGLVISNSCTPQSFSPTEAQRIAQEIGATNADSYEVFSACPAFALHMDYLNNFDEQKLPEYVLCIATETMTHKVNYNDRTDGAIWGDGAAAWIESAKHAGMLKVIDTHFHADARRAGAVVVDTFGFFHQDGRAVRDFSVRQTVRLIKRLEEQFQIDWTRDVFIGHQANATMLQQITNNRGIDDAHHWRNVKEVGNQGGAGAPAVLAEHWKDLSSGQKIVVAVVGAGLSWGSVLFEVQ